MKAIEVLISARPIMLCEVFSTTGRPDDRPEPALAALLQALANDFRAEAELWTKSGRKGWQSISTDLRKAAGRVAEVSIALDKLTGPNPHRAPAELSHATNGSLVYRPDGESESLAYLRGDTDVPPNREDTSLTPIDGVFPDQVATIPPGPVSDRIERAITDPSSLVRRDRPVRHDLHTEARQMTQTFPIPPTDRPAALRALAGIDDPFSDPKPPSWSSGAGRYVPSGGRQLTFIDLMTPPPAHLVPQHWSWSQLSASEDCGVQYRMSRIENLTQIPQWANIGGDAFHKASQWIDEARSIGVTQHDVPETWEKAFSEAIAAVASTSPVPIDKWRAANGGKEGQDWWRVEGERMLAMFVEQRTKLAAAANPRTIARLPHGATGEPTPAIEWPFTITIDGPMGPLMFANIIDRVWQCSDGLLLIEDLKSGSRMPQDTTQLGAYAWGVALSTGMLPSAIMPRIMGTFYDARKGIWTPAVDLLAAHPWEELVYRVHSAEAKRRAGLYTPHVSNFCTSCSVQYACPLRNREGSSTPGSSS
jgi:hypothetical protein